MFEIGAYELTLITTMGIAVTFALSLNLITGFCGQISLGHAAFYGVGAYTSAMLTKAGIPFPLAIIGAAAMASIIGVIVGLASLRVRHDFLAITTMGVGFLFLGIVRTWDFLGAEMGIAGIPGSGLDKSGYAILVIVIAVVVALFSLYVKRSWMGMSSTQSPTMKIPPALSVLTLPVTKLAAFAMGTALAGVAGALYTHQVRFIDPASFSFVESITVLSMVVIGGIGSVWGVIFAAGVLSVLPQWFQFIDDFKLLVYGALLFAVMRFSPGGVAGMVKALRGDKKNTKKEAAA